jgi:CHASE2 domain-containing sensor protein
VIAGAICEQSDCTGLMWIILGALAAVILLSALAGVGSWLYVEDMLAGRGWRRASRIATACAAGVVSVGLLWLLVWVPFVGPPLAFGVSVAAVPLAVRRRRRPARRQSKPCSTA